MPGIAALVVATMCWAAGTVLTKYALGDFPPITLLLVELVAANVVVWTVLLRRGYRRPRSYRRLALIGLLEPAIAYGARTVGLGMTSAANASLLSGTEALFGVLLAALCLGERLGARSVIGLLVAVGGVMSLGGGPSFAELGPGDGLVLCEAFTAAVYSVIVARMVRREDAVSVTAHQFGFGLLFVAPVALWQWVSGAEQLPVHAGAGSWAAALTAGALGFGMSFLLYNRAIVHVPVSSAAMILNLIPIFGVAAAVVVLGETLTAGRLVGALLVVGGIMLFPLPTRELVPVLVGGQGRSPVYLFPEVTTDRRTPSGRRGS